MARRRMIDPSIWDDEHVGKLSSDAFRVFMACISNADDEGKLEAGASRVCRLTFSYDREKTDADVEKLLCEIADGLRSFQRYAVNGREYVKLLKWRDYQSINRPTPSKLPEPTGTDNGRVSHTSSTNHAQISEQSVSNHAHLNERAETIEEKGKERNTDTNVSGAVAPSENGQKPDPQSLQQLVAYYIDRLNSKFILMPQDVNALRGGIAGSLKTLMNGRKLKPAEIREDIDAYIDTQDPAWKPSNMAHKPGPGLIAFSDQKRKAVTV